MIKIKENTTMAEDKINCHANELSVNELEKVTGGATYKKKPIFKEHADEISNKGKSADYCQPSDNDV